ncbi:hypothetical protein HanIR_Chr05g0238111 [Helianthus annuus]|nr:hypothetical protein HanIR_Chr05g0238111 [Helianthus annuus]
MAAVVFENFHFARTDYQRFIDHYTIIYTNRYITSFEFNCVFQTKRRNGYIIFQNTIVSVVVYVGMVDLTIWTHRFSGNKPTRTM